MDTIKDVFWIWHDHDYSWDQRRFQGRRNRKGEEKEEENRNSDNVEDSLDQGPKEKEGKKKEQPCRR